MFASMDSTPIEPGAKSKLTSIRLGMSQDEALGEIVASDPKVSRGRIIRAALDEYLAKHYGRNGAA
jgi:Arc/MetJ-type ribon-helix-helix transcriptional regulator